MPKRNLFYYEPKFVREKLREAGLTAKQIHDHEDALIQQLIEIDTNKFYLRVGLRSLTSFVRKGLRFGETQTQRIETRVRREQQMSRNKAQVSHAAREVFQPDTKTE